MASRTDTVARPQPVARLGSVPADAKDDCRFLQQRLALYAATVAALSALFLVVSWIAQWAFDRDFLEDPNRPSHIAATAAALALWVVAKNPRTFSLPVLQGLDAAGTLVIALMLAVMAHLITPVATGTLIGLLAIAYLTLARAAQVPSTPERTFVLTALAFAGLVVSSLVRSLPPEYPQTLVGRAFATLDVLLWSVAGVALASVASKVIYGLQEKLVETRQLGQYTLENEIGGGGMGEIYRARHAMLRRPTAIKLLSGEHSETSLRRFGREVQLTASLSHPNTKTIQVALGARD